MKKLLFFALFNIGFMLKNFLIKIDYLRVNSSPFSIEISHGYEGRKGVAINGTIFFLENSNLRALSVIHLVK